MNVWENKLRCAGCMKGRTFVAVSQKSLFFIFVAMLMSSYTARISHVTQNQQSLHLEILHLAYFFYISNYLLVVFVIIVVFQ